MAERKRLICASAALMDGGPGVCFNIAGPAGERAAFVVRFGGKAHAYLNQCPHNHVELDWKAGEFFDSAGIYLICAMHGAIFDPTNGACLSGPCNGRGLSPVAIVEVDGGVFLETEGE